MRPNPDVPNSGADFYVYLHRAAGAGRVFYVGKGVGQRAWTRAGRTPEWVKEAKDGYVVEVLAGGLSEGAAYALERSTIRQLAQDGVPIVNCRAGSTFDPMRAGRRAGAEADRSAALLAAAVADAPLTLTREELGALTGMRNVKAMEGWLRRRGWLHQPRGRRLEPAVDRDYFRSRMQQQDAGIET